MRRRLWQYALCGHVVWNSKSTPTVTLSVNLDHISRKPCNTVVFLKICFSHKMASATKRFRNAVSFKLNRFMPLSQTIYRKQCLLHFELRGCIVSKKREKPLYARDMLTVAFSFAKLPFELGSLHSEYWVLSPVAFCTKSSAELFRKTQFLGSSADRTHFRRRPFWERPYYGAVGTDSAWASSLWNN